MSFQYIHTSAKRGLEPGRSGFCCVARDRDMPPDLVTELEQQSRYHQFSKSVAPTILRHRIARLRSGTYHILTRIQDAGADYSKRNNHIAHHIAFAESETSELPNPASILLHWTGWRAHWDEPPRVLGPTETFHIQDVETKWSLREGNVDLPRLIESGVPLRRVVELDAGEEGWLIVHIRAALNDPRIGHQWRYPVTNLLLPTDAPGDYVWAGAWRNQPLPYEIDLAPRPADPAPVPPTQPPAKTPTAADEETEAAEPVAPANAPKYGRTVVEIPETFDRSARRRPKRKFGHREFARAVNFAVAGLALLSIAIAAYWYWRNQEQVGTLIEEKVDASKSTPLAAATERFQTKWTNFVANGYPARFLQEADQAATFFATQGNDEPAEVVAFLKRIRSRAPIPPGAPLPVPSRLVSVNDDGASLKPPASEYPRLKALALAPRPLLQAVGQLDNGTTNPYSLFSGFLGASYQPEAMRAALSHYDQFSQDSLAPQTSVAKIALRKFLMQKEETLANPQFQPLLSIQEAFGLPPSAAYLAFTDEGLVADSSEPRYATYLIDLFSNHVLANYANFKSSAPFRAAFNRIGTQNFETAQGAAKSIYDAILLAEPKSEAQARSWQAVQDAWTKTFIRRDLMEEAIVAYTIEALETARDELATLQMQFSAQDLRNHSLYQTLEQQLERAAQEVQPSASSSEEWVVFEPQTAK